MRLAFGWLLLCLLALGNTAVAQVTIFTENMGNPSGTTSVNAYTGWQNGTPINFSSTANTDVRTTNASSGYTGATGAGNVFMGTSGGNFKDFIIAGVNSNGYSSITLSFGLKNESSSALPISVSVSTDGITYTSLTFTNPSNTAWTLITAGGGIPATANLRIKFEKNNSSNYRIDDIKLTGIISGPIVAFSTASSSASEGAGTATINMAINPVTTGAGTISITIGGGTATYGADYTTFPAAVANVITVSVPLGADSASFTINIVDDALDEGDETIPFTITGATGGTVIGVPTTHTFTIQDNDYVPTVEFAVPSISALEGAGAQTFTINFTSPHPSGNLTIQITNGPGVTYGIGNDYTTSQGSGSFTIPFGPVTGTGTTSLSFTATPLIDGLPEPTEHVIFTITAVSDPTIVIGSNASSTLYISDINSPPTVLLPGDLAIVGVNARNSSCGADLDFVSFFCFKEIVHGTTLILTDNGYERCNPGQWGNQEGAVQLTRTGPAIPAGQVVTFQIKQAAPALNVTGVAPDALWSCARLGPTGTVAMNDNGEQLFFMQGGTWSHGVTNGNNATYTGTILYAFSTNPTFPWSASCSSTPNQRSNLPPGVECFSMAPTAASDFSKYIGDTSAADQRDWIMRIDDTSNWNSYSSCTQYNTSGYDWLTAPILPIIPGTMTHGLWRGGKDTDWFECKNWDDARIPDAATNVVIDVNAVRNCEVGLVGGNNPGGTAVCASVLQNYGATAVKALNVMANSTLNIGGPLTIQHTAGTGTVTTAVLNNATLSATDVNITGHTANNLDALLRAEVAGSLVKASGNMNIGMGGRLDLSGAMGTSGTLELGGDFTNTDGEVQFSDLYSKVVFNGAANQSVTNPGFTENFFDVQVNKAGGELQLSAPITIANQLDLTLGRVLTTGTNLLTVKAGGTAINTSDASFIKGPMQKIGNTDFIFPIGKGSSYRPASVTSLAGGAGSAFTAEYFALNPETAIGPLALPTSLHHISHCEYWMIERSVSSPNAKVTLSWDTPESCGVTAGALGELRVARWDGFNWLDRGNGGTTGNATAGTVITGGVEAAFGPWTLASITANNPLPIQLLSFTAVPAGTQVDLRWSTASEQDNDHFTVERSADAMDFENVSQVPGAGNSQGVIDYADVDPAPLGGLSYYRLRQTDLNGTSTVSQVVPVFFGSKAKQPLTVLYGHDGTFLLHDFPAGSMLEVMDLTGRVVSHAGIASSGTLKLPLEGLAHGVYVLRMSDGARVESTRLAY